MDRLTPEEIERLLEGHSAPERLKSLQESLQAMRSAFSAPPSPDVRGTHLQAMMAAFGQHAPVPQTTRRIRRARVLRRASVAVAASVLVGGSALAATGSLPAPAQDALAKVAHGLGINLPNSTPGPHVPDLPGPHFAQAKRNWLDCVKEHGKDACGPKPTAQDFVSPGPKTSNEPHSTEPSEHGVGNPHHSPFPTSTPNPGHGGENPGAGHETPKPTNAHSEGEDNSGSGGLHTPKPIPTPHVDD